MSLLATIKSIFGFKPAKTAGLAPGDRHLICADCEEKFVFDAGEQKFFKAKGFTDPKRCPECRKKVRTDMRKKYRGRRRSRGHGGHGGNGGRDGGRGNDHSLIDGSSPYADER